MTIFKLEISEVSPHSFAVTSLTETRKNLRSTEFYKTKELAEARQKDIYEGLHKLAGFLPNVEARITTVEVIES